MNSGIVLLLLALVLVCSFSFADIGPSPSFSFSVEGVPEDHKLFYAGNIRPEKLELVSEETQVYKLNTHIVVYAVPNKFVEEELTEANFKEVAAASIKSQEIDLSAGHTVFGIESLNGKSMLLEVKNSTPDEPAPDYTLVIGVVVLVVIGVVVFSAVKRKK